MNIAITGASGFLGRHIADRLTADGFTVRPVSLRFPPTAERFEGCDAVIHLAGEPVAQRWTPEVRKHIVSSRVDNTKALVEALRPHPPKVLISGSAIGYYGSRGDQVLTEEAGPGDDFLAEVVTGWEREARVAEEFGVRVVRIRTSAVLGTDGGALKMMLLPFRLGVGGRLGDGKHWMSWIHIQDFVELVRFGLIAPTLTGAVNMASPNPVRNELFTQALAQALHRPAMLPVPRFALKLLFGEMSDVMFASQRVSPAAAERAGFQFKFPEIGPAFRDLLK